jgi:hypothetical protein
VPELNFIQGAAIPVQNPVKGGVTSPDIGGNPSGEGGAVKSAVTEGSVGGITILQHPVFIVCNLGDEQTICNSKLQQFIKNLENLSYKR